MDIITFSVNNVKSECMMNKGETCHKLNNNVSKTNYDQKLEVEQINISSKEWFS